MGYRQMIRETLARNGRVGANPVHVEAWMRCEHPTLDALSPAQFRDETERAACCAEASTPAENDALAQSFGLAA